MLKSLLAAMAVGLLAFVGGGDDTVKLDGVKCVMMANKAAKADKSVDYRGAKVYLCCDGCVKKFKADDAKISTMANHQLALTGQFTQKACPISGGATKDDLAEKAKLCFGNEAFDKGFEAKKKASK
jgi:YHS domain-containing protein